MLNFNHAIMGSRHIVSPFWAMGQSTPAYPVGGGGGGWCGSPYKCKSDNGTSSLTSTERYNLMNHKYRDDVTLLAKIRKFDRSKNK